MTNQTPDNNDTPPPDDNRNPEPAPENNTDDNISSEELLDVLRRAAIAEVEKENETSNSFNTMFDDVEEETAEDIAFQNANLRQQIIDLTQSISRAVISNDKLANERDAVKAELDQQIDDIEKAAKGEKSALIATFIAELTPVVELMEQSLQAAVESGDAHAASFGKTLQTLKDTFDKFAAKSEPASSTPQAEPAPQDTATPQADEEKTAEAPQNTEAPATASIEELREERFTLLSQASELGNALGRYQTEKSKLRQQIAAARNDALGVLQRARTSVATDIEFALEKPMKDLMPVIDTMEIGLRQAKKSQAPHIAEGFEKTLTKLDEIFNRHGITKIDPKGQRFDEKLHEAISTVPTPEGMKEDDIVTVAQKGYAIKNRVIRYARVITAE
jgi:molecular chaperone GrpE